MTAEDVDALRAAAHLYEQRKVLAAVLGTAGRALWRSGSPHAAPAAAIPLPGPQLCERTRAPSRALVRDYSHFLGAPADAYAHPATVPAHLFPQWTFPLAARALRGLPYPLTRILNAGCRLEINAPVPASAPLVTRARLVAVDDDGRRALIHQRVETDTVHHPRAIVADLYAVAPHSSPPRNRRAGARREGIRPASSDGKREVARVPRDARELARFHFGPRAGLAFALLTGDINPVHWLPVYARAAGFAAPILHGFALLARAMEGLARALYAGATDRIRVVDVKFKQPLVLGKGVDIGLYLDAGDPGRFYLATTPSGRAYALGTFEAREHRPFATSAAAVHTADARPLVRGTAGHSPREPSVEVGGTHA